MAYRLVTYHQDMLMSRAVVRQLSNGSKNKRYHSGSIQRVSCMTNEWYGYARKMHLNPRVGLSYGSGLCTQEDRGWPLVATRHVPSRCGERMLRMASSSVGDDDGGSSSSSASSSSSSSAGNVSPSSPSPGVTGGGPKSPPEGFATLERVIQQTMGGGEGKQWNEVDGCWVLYPPESDQGRDMSKVSCLVHFVGGAFVGAAPQVAYKRILEGLAARGALVVATPYATGFDHLRTVDEVYFKYSRCVKSLGPGIQMLPTYGLGHSLGSLIQVLVCSRYVVPRAGNILMSFNNRPATDSIPFLSPFIAPSARALGPLLSQLATSPLRSGVEQWIDIFKGASPETFRQVLPLLEQLTPIYLDVANGTEEFTPPPEETRKMIKDGYAINKNLLLKFSDDSIDETPVLASVLQSSPLWNQGSLELMVKSLPGDHARPMQQDLSEFSPEFAEFTSQRLSESETFWNSVGSLAEQATGLPPIAKEQLTGLAKTASSMTSMFGDAVGASPRRSGEEKQALSMDALVDEIGSWMGLASQKQTEPRALPSPSPSESSSNNSPLSSP